ncbi:hypothetical protein FKP32DRAFT_1672782 [Trametes sanguinea]|nr:hypothetical protein FKP32DRAFT_1672782 [Trametes sanguinea]
MVQPKTEPEDAVLPPADANPAPKPPPKAAADKAKEAKAKNDALEQIAEYRRVTAWAIARWPLEKRVVHERVRVHLPRTYRARHGVDVRTVWPGTDLNQFVHRHYDEGIGGGKEPAKDDSRRKDGKDGKKESERERAVREEWENFVAAEAIQAKRHEYLGPDPRVAGYWIDADGDYHIKWYDAFLKDQWVDNRKWSFDVRLNARGEWVEVDDPE